MPNVRTPSTSDFSNLETKDRNDNTTLHNTTTATTGATSTATTVSTTPTTSPDMPDTSKQNEMEVPKTNEVHPGQNHGDMDEDAANKKNEETDLNKDQSAKQVNPGTQTDANARTTEQKTARNEDVNTLGNQGDDDKIELELR